MNDQSRFIFETADENKTTTLFNFEPKSQKRLNQFLVANANKTAYYFQKPHEGFSNGILFSYILFSEKVKFFLRKKNDHLPSNFTVERGPPKDNFSELKELAISHNEDGLIFPAGYLKNFKQNSILIGKNDFSIQVYENSKLIGHISAVKQKSQLFSEEENLFLLMRFVVHKNYREAEIKEFLLYELAKYLPESASLYLQVFPKNVGALRFFLRRINVSVAFEKWEVLGGRV